jgi:hypothetical protein
MVVRVNSPASSPSVTRSIAIVALCFAFTPASKAGAGLCRSSLRPLAVQDFIDHPKRLLSEVMTPDSMTLESRAYNLAINGSQATAALMNLVPYMRSDQLIALAKGMARATGECRIVNPSISRAIDEQARRVQNWDFRTTFTNYASADLDSPNIKRSSRSPTIGRPLPIQLTRETPLPSKIIDPYEGLDKTRLH